MRIGIDARLWGQTGVGRYIRNIVINLQKIDLKNQYVLFVNTQDLENLKTQITNPKWRVVETDIKWHTISEQIKFSSILKKENLDLVHFPYFSVPIFYNKPFVVTIHDLIVHHFPTGKASTLALPLYGAKLIAYKYVIKSAAKKAKKIITVSNTTKDEVADHLKVNKDKIITIYNGIDKNLQNTKTKERIIPSPYFLYVGNAYPHKNLERLIAAFKELLSEHKNVKLVLVGNKDFFYERLEKKVLDLNLKENVIFYQKANDSELINLYQNALALVMPSLMEGFGLPVAEAMANNCLVLAADIPSLREICQDGAIYFNPKKQDEIYKDMEFVIKGSKIKEKLIKEGFIRSSIFSWEKSATETLNVYESCISL